MRSRNGERSDCPALTRRERDVLVELCRPMLGAEAFKEPASTRRIAEALVVSDAAVKQHLLRLYDKFDVYEAAERRRVKLANEAVRRGAVSVADLAGSADVIPPPSTDALEAGRQAFARRAWHKAFALLTEAASSGAALTPQDLEGLGEAALWTAHHDESVIARQAAHNLYVKAGDRRGAARLALGLVINNVIRLNGAVAAGWLNKARRHLAQEPECPEHGWLACAVAMEQLRSGNLKAAIDSARDGFRVGQCFNDPDLIALGLTFEGFALVRQGEVRRGLDMLDEAMTSASAGELGTLATGITYCRTLCACFDMYDIRRALEWTAAIHTSEEETGSVGFPGDCRAHEAAVLIARGEWVKGEAQAKAACAESETFDLAHTGLATYELGELHLRLGNLDQAEAFFCRAQELGMLPEPGRALLCLVRGDAAAASASIEAALAEVSGDRLSRTRLLPAAVDIALANGQIDRAHQAATELASSSEEYGATALRAAAACATGAVVLASGDAGAATAHLRLACRLWLEAEAPYETARTRLRLADALAALGDAAGSALETATARRQLEQLRISS